MMLANWSVVIFAFLWSSSYACNPNEFCIIDESNENIQNLLASMDYFTTQLIQKLIYNPNLSMNVVISPMSIYTVLVLVLFGSAGDTQKELVKALHFPDTDMQQVQKSFGDILIATDVKRNKMVNGKKDILLEGQIIQGLFFQKDFTLVDTYGQYLNSLNIKAEPVDFINNVQDAINTIKKWIEDSKSKSNLLSLADSINKNTRIFLTTLFHFNAAWADSVFLDTMPNPVPFHTLDNTKIDVNMMKISSSLLYYDNKSTYTAVEIPYTTTDYWEDFTAIFILPYKEVDSVRFATSFTMDILTEFYSKAEPKDIDGLIPTFSYSYSIELTGQLEELGIKQLFAKADLSNMLKVKEEENLTIPISHTCDLTVNEKGTIGNDSTENGSDDSAKKTEKKNPPSKDIISFIADYPFLMFIRNTHSHAIAFATFFYKV